MVIKSFKLNKKVFAFILILCIFITSTLMFYSIANSKQIFINIENDMLKNENTDNNYNTNDEEKQSDNNYIKWVDFNVSYDALNLTSKLDIDSHNNNSQIKYNWVELLAYLACKNGGNFKNFKQKDLTSLTDKLNQGISMEDLTKDKKYYNYYYEAYSAVLENFIGNYSIETIAENGSKSFSDKYGIKAFLPIAKNYNFSHYDDFGNSRSYGFKRVHLGNDLMGSIGTPIIAVESGIIEHLGWNQYGGWRIGIRSINSKRYYYYAHLRKNHPYIPDLKEGDIVKAGDVIGYLGMTGYSTKENVNNINVPHLHFGMELVFDESQMDSAHEIWIDVYNIIEFLKKNKSQTYMSNPDTKDYSRVLDYNENGLNE